LHLAATETVVEAFNAKAKAGMQLAIQHGFCEASPASVARFLIDWADGPPPGTGGGLCGGLSKEQVGEYLGSPDDFNVAALSASVPRPPVHLPSI
jgi:hypothetical protein